jgi:ABC-type sugar transport system permease subunit
MLSSRTRDRLFPYWLILPTAILIVVIIIYPLYYSVNLSMRDVSIGDLRNPNEAEWVGLANYYDQFQDRLFWEISLRTAYLTFISVAAALIIGLIVALVLNQKFVGRKVVRILILIPWVLPTMVVSSTWIWILNGNYGALNGLLLQLGLIDKYITYLGNVELAIYAISLVKIWKEVPFVALMLLASLQTIPKDLYEAARIDGAGTWSSFLKITLPLLRPALMVVLVLQTVWAFRIFDLVYAMTQGGPANQTMVIAYWTYLQAFRFHQYGAGSALAYIVTIFLVLLSLVYIKTVGTKVEY